MHALGEEEEEEEEQQDDVQDVLDMQLAARGANVRYACASSCWVMADCGSYLPSVVVLHRVLHLRGSSFDLRRASSFWTRRWDRWMRTRRGRS